MKFFLLIDRRMRWPLKSLPKKKTLNNFNWSAAVQQQSFIENCWLWTVVWFFKWIYSDLFVIILIETCICPPTIFFYRKLLALDRCQVDIMKKNFLGEKKKIFLGGKKFSRYQKEDIKKKIISLGVKKNFFLSVKRNSFEKNIF